MQCIQYEISAADPTTHLFHIKCHIPEPSSDGQRISLPAWIPGSYLIRDFAKNIVSIQASTDGRKLCLQAIDKDSWQCEPCPHNLLIEYTVYAGDDSVRAAKLDTQKGFFNGTSVFLRVHGQEQRACTVSIGAPESAGYESWHVATAMSAVNADKRGFGAYRAEDYDELVDHPVAMGKFTLARFQANGVPHSMALFGRHHAEPDRLCQDVQRICEHHIGFFQDAAPFKHYLFIVMVVGDGYGGLEHRASSVLICSRKSLPTSRRGTVDEHYREFLGLCSHEYFHAWNIKRIKPAAFIPIDYQKENYTRLLWMFEGVTSYYDDLALVRCGLIDSASYLELLGRTITRVLSGKGRLRQSIADSSFYAWTKFYKQDENAANAIVSYYAKGCLVALALDSKIRHCTQNKCSLDDVMRKLWLEYGKTGKGISEHTVEELAGQIAGTDLKAFFNQALYSTEDLALDEHLAAYGIDLRLRSARFWHDKGGVPAAPEELPPTETGAIFKKQGGTLKVIRVSDGSPAQQAGLWVGDELIACNGLKASQHNIQSELKQSRPGDTLQLHSFRADELQVLNLSLRAPEQTCSYLEINEDANEDQRAARRVWLQSEE